MPRGSKTRKTALQRFKVTASGKLLRLHSRTSHLRSKESADTHNRKKSGVEAPKEFRKVLKQMIRS